MSSDNQIMQQEFIFAAASCKNVRDGIVLLFMTDEAWFHISGHVNAQNVRI
jgi:hypothetical protein